MSIIFHTLSLILIKRPISYSIRNYHGASLASKTGLFPLYYTSLQKKKKGISRGLAVVKEKENLSKRPIKAASQVTCQPQKDQAQGEARATNRK